MQEGGKWPRRFNLRLSDETADAYEEFSKLSGIEMTTLLRSFVDASVPAVEGMSDAIKQAQLGNAGLAVEIVQRFADKLVAEGALYQVKTQALGEEVKAKTEAGKSA